MTRYTTPTYARRVKRDKCFLAEMTGSLYPTLKEAIRNAETRGVWRVWLYEGRMYRYKVYDCCTQYCTIAQADARILRMIEEGKDPAPTNQH